MSQFSPAHRRSAGRRLVRAFRRELLLAAVFLAIAGAAWIFFEITDEVLERESDGVDRAILQWVLSLGHPPRSVDIARDITALGSTFVLSFVICIATLFLALSGRYRTGLLVLVSTGVGMLLSSGMKTLIARERPDVIPHDLYVATASFPSGHAMLSAVAYLTLAALLAGVLPTHRLKVFVVAAAAVVTGLVGMSRIYLGVHWPSDVAAGWAAGAAWALGRWASARVFFPSRTSG